MAEPKILLEPDKYYHIYNRGINSWQIFIERTNYEHFLKLYGKYISNVADTFAWVLMGNHFHLLVRVKNALVLELNLRDLNLRDFQDLEGLGLERIEKYIIQQFSNLFNAYTKAFNKKYQRTGSLFKHSFKRKLIEDEKYLKQMIIYIHNNPVKHHFCNHPAIYPWSSYQNFLSSKSTELHQEIILNWFDNKSNFIASHNERSEIS